MRQAGGSAATIYSSGGMPVQSAVLNSGTIAAIENADLNSSTIPLLRGAFVPRDFGTAIEGVSLLRVPLLGTIDSIYLFISLQTRGPSFFNRCSIYCTCMHAPRQLHK